MDPAKELEGFLAEQMNPEETAMILNRDFGPEELYALEPEYDDDGHLIRLKKVQK